MLSRGAVGWKINDLVFVERLTFIPTSHYDVIVCLSVVCWLLLQHGRTTQRQRSSLGTKRTYGSTLITPTPSGYSTTDATGTGGSRAGPGVTFRGPAAAAAGGRTISTHSEQLEGDGDSEDNL